MLVEGNPLPALRERWPIFKDGSVNDGSIVGHASSCAFSPKYNANLLFAMLSIGVSEPGTTLSLQINGADMAAEVRNDRWLK